MKREDIARVFDGATDEQIKALLDINSGDIGKAKSGMDVLHAQIADLTAQLTVSNDTIKQLEASQGDAAAMQAEIDRYKTAEAARADAEKKAAARAAVETRFDAVVGERTFLHEMVRKGVLEDFERAIADAANAGKSDKDVFEALTKDKEFFSSQNPPPGGMGSTKPLSSVTDLEKFRKMSLYDQMLFAKQYPERAADLMRQEG